MTVLFGTEPTIVENPYNSEIMKVRDKLKIKASIRSCGTLSFPSMVISFQVCKTVISLRTRDLSNRLVLLSN